MYYILNKGQNKSKWFFQAYFSSKKRTNEFYFTTMKPQADLFSFVYWRKLKTPKRHIEINCPLPFKNFSATTEISKFGIEIGKLGIFKVNFLSQIKRILSKKFIEEYEIRSTNFINALLVYYHFWSKLLTKIEPKFQIVCWS